MAWLAVYAVAGFTVAVIFSVLADRFHTHPNSAILLSALIWPVIVLGAVQMGLWTLFADVLGSASDTAAEPMMLRLDAPPL